MYGQFFVIFALMLTGYFFRKIKVISDEMNQSINKLIICFSFPCFIFQKVAGLDMQSGFLKEFSVALVLSVALFLIYGLYAFGYTKIRRVPQENAAAAELMMVFPNNAFMGFPIAYIFFGDMGLLFMLANNIAMNLMIFSYGVFALRRNDGDKGFSLKLLAKCLINPNILALIFGLLFYLLKIRIPEEAAAYLTYAGSICTPMSMIYIGSTLLGTNLIDLIKDRLILESVVNKNVIMPLLTYALVVFLPLSPLLKALLVFAACFPSATLASVLVETEGKNGVLACRILAVSTAVSIISIPLAVKFIHLLIMPI